MGGKRGVFAQARDTKNDDLVTYCSNMAPITCRVGTQLFVLALVAAMMVIGITKINDCPINNFIPLYLIASSGLYVGWLVIELICDQCEYLKVKTIVRILMSLTKFGFFVAGNIWVYGAWETVETREKVLDNSDYCNPYVYWLAFCNITICTAICIIVVFSLIVWCFVACCLKLCCKGELGESTPLTQSDPA